jgi:tetratricopeptide (TPR) repeat protein
MGEALFRRGQNQQAREYLLRALVSLGSPYPISSRGVRLAIGKELFHQAWHRWSSWFGGKRLPEGVKGVAQEKCRIYSLLAWMDYFMDPERLVLDSLLELNLAEKSGLAVERVLAAMGIGLVCDAIPLPRLARFYHSLAVALAEKSQQPMALGQAYLGLALHEHHAQGKRDRAFEHYRRSATAYWEAGHLRRWAGVKMAESLLWFQENITDRLNLCREVIRVSQDAADRQSWGWGLFMLAATLDQAGALEEAVANMQQALDLLQSVPDYQVVVFASGILGRCYLRQGNLPQALAVLENGCRLILKHRLRGFSCGPVRVNLAQALLIKAEQAGEPVRGEAMEKAKEACQEALRQVKFDRATQIAAYRMQGTFVWLKGKPERARQWWQRSLEGADALGAPYERGLTWLEMGRFLKDLGYLEKAGAIFGELGANFDWRQAQKLRQQYQSQPGLQIPLKESF